MTSLIERANAADRVIDAPFNLAHAGADEFFAWMTDAVDALATSDIESGMSGFDGDIADDTSTSWLFWISLSGLLIPLAPQMKTSGSRTRWRLHPPSAWPIQ